MICCYHGTSEENATSIRETGFREWTWFAKHLEDAIGFGGLHVFKVAFNDPPDHWQFMSENIVLPENIVEYSVYTEELVMRNEELGKKVFQSNIGE